MSRLSEYTAIRCWLKALALAGLLLLTACSDEAPLSPEQRIRLMLDKAETAVEARDLAAVAGLISSKYQDPGRRNYQELRRLLAGYFLRHRSIHILKQVDSLNLKSDQQAQAVLYVGVAGTLNPAVASLGQWTGDLIRLEVELTLEQDDAWRLQSAQWRRAKRGDILH